MTEENEMTASEFANSLTIEQVLRLHEIIAGKLPQEIAEMTDDELLAALAE